MLTKEKMQEVFSFVYTSLVKQGCPSLNSEYFCCYHGDYGEKCAIGHLIPDSKYSPELEGKLVDSLIVAGVLNFSLCDAPFLESLQACHDEPSLSPNWLEEFKALMGKVAKAYKLTVPEII